MLLLIYLNEYFAPAAGHQSEGHLNHLYSVRFSTQVKAVALGLALYVPGKYGPLFPWGHACCLSVHNFAGPTLLVQKFN